PGSELVAALAELASAHLWSGTYEAVIATADRTTALADRLGLPAPARTVALRGLARCLRGELEGVAEMQRALGFLVADGRGRDAAAVHNNLALVLWCVEG